MKLPYLFFLIILIGTSVHPVHAKKKTPPRTPKKEYLTKLLRICRACMDIAGGSYLINGSLYEMGDGDWNDSEEVSALCKGQYIGFSLACHGVYNLYSELVSRRFKLAIQAFLETLANPDELHKRLANMVSRLRQPKSVPDNQP